MKRLVYFSLLPFIYIISLLPFPLLYGVSNGLFFLVYHVIGYRKKVVHENLCNAFPNKTKKEILIIQKRFYRHLCDLILETLKGLTISAADANARCKLNPATVELIKQYYNNKQSFMLVLGHWGNWEWAGNSFSQLGLNQLYVIYHPLTNKYFNDLIIKMRTRFGTKLIPMSETIKEMIRNKDEINTTAFIADQTPSPENAYWTTFLNQDTPVFWGTERIAQKLKLPVIYINIDKIKRGWYEMNAETLVSNPESSPTGEITELHTRRLEKDILYKPEFWLWSHRRWKHKRK